MTDGAILLAARDVARHLPIEDCIRAIERTLRSHDAGGGFGPASTGFALPAGSVHAKLAAVEEDGRVFVAVKANVNLPGNAGRHGRPTIQGALLLFDGDDGRPLAIMDSIAITSIRTAAVAALAARCLALPEATSITVIGCGEQGEIQLRAMASIRPLQNAFVIDLDHGKAIAFARRMSEELGWVAVATRDAAAAVAASAICVTCTTASSPLLFADHLHPGLFVAAVGADNPSKQEIDAAALARSKVVVDSLAACAASGDLHHALAAGVMTERDVHGELAAIVAGRIAGRKATDEIFVFDSTGTALQDVAAAIVVYKRAAEALAGQRFVLDDRIGPAPPAGVP
jgi:ornithine cyclodeaminase/alanine dehydrogenase-like protein (mu-crystallin family)